MHLDIEEYVSFLEKLRSQGEDNEIFKIVEDLASAGIGGIGGIAAAPAVAGLLGVTELWGSTWLASTFLGSIFAVTTPIGWVLGIGAAGGALVYGFTQLVRMDATTATHRKRDIENIERHVANLKRKASTSAVKGIKFTNLLDSIQLLVENNILSPQKSNELIFGVQAGKISYNFAFQAVSELLKQYDLELRRHLQNF